MLFAEQSPMFPVVQESAPEENQRVVEAREFTHHVPRRSSRRTNRRKKVSTGSAAAASRRRHRAVGVIRAAVARAYGSVTVVARAC